MPDGDSSAGSQLNSSTKSATVQSPSFPHKEDDTGTESTGNYMGEDEIVDELEALQKQKYESPRRCFR